MGVASAKAQRMQIKDDIRHKLRRQSIYRNGDGGAKKMKAQAGNSEDGASESTDKIVNGVA